MPVLVLACARSSEPTGNPTVAPVSTERATHASASADAALTAPAHTGHADASCAPWDGAALDLTIDDGDSCGAPSAPSTSIHIWQGLPLSAGRTLVIEDASKAGSLVRCAAVGKRCEVAKRAELTIDTYVDGVQVAGHYTATFRDGTRESARFDLKWCARRAMCG